MCSSHITQRSVFNLINLDTRRGVLRQESYIMYNRRQKNKGFCFLFQTYFCFVTTTSTKQRFKQCGVGKCIRIIRIHYAGVSISTTELFSMCGSCIISIIDTTALQLKTSEDYICIFKIGFFRS